MSLEVQQDMAVLEEKGIKSQKKSYEKIWKYEIKSISLHCQTFKKTNKMLLTNNFN